MLLVFINHFPQFTPFLLAPFKSVRGVLLQTYMKWFLAVKTMLNTHINVKIIEDILFQQQTNKNTEEVGG
jgi:hypothetical protein